jgi:NifU-like protein
VSSLPEVAAEHFFHPRNVGQADEPSFEGRAASLICGGQARFSIQVDEGQRVSQAKFRAAGCTVLVASLSLLTESVVNVPTAEAAVIGQHIDELKAKFPALEACREHCPALAGDALLAAIRQYSDAARDEWAGDEALICTCFFVSERTIEREIQGLGLRTVAEVTRACNAGGGCGSCHQLIQEIIDTHYDLPR